MKLQRLSACLLTAAVLPACYLDIGSRPEPEPEPWFVDASVSDSGPSFDAPRGWVDAADMPTNSLNLSAVVVSGELGGVASGDENYVYRAEGGDANLSLDIRTRSESGVVMNRLMIDRADLLAAGQSYDNPVGYDPDRVAVRVVGCSGPRDNVWSYDSSTTDVTMEVREGPEEGSLEVFYSARFFSSTTSANATEGSFVLPAR